MLRDEVAKYTELSGNDGEHTPICVIGAYLDGYDKGLELSVSENPNKWIPVSENPKEYDRYLTYHKDGKMHVGTWGLFGWNYGHYVEDVIAWMPLPDPYKA